LSRSSLRISTISASSISCAAAVSLQTGISSQAIPTCSSTGCITCRSPTTIIPSARRSASSSFCSRRRSLWQSMCCLPVTDRRILINEAYQDKTYGRYRHHVYHHIGDQSGVPLSHPVAASGIFFKVGLAVFLRRLFPDGVQPRQL